LVREVLARHPRVEAARWGVKAAQAREPQASGFGDLMLEGMVAPQSGFGGVPWGQAVSVGVPLPRLGELGAREAGAKAETRMAEQGVEMQRRELALEACMLWSDLYEVERSLEANAHHREVLGDLERLAQARLGANRGRLSDLHTLEIELSRMEMERARMERMGRQARIRLNALLGRAPGEPLPVTWDKGDPWGVLEGAVADPGIPAQPELQEAEARVAGQEAMLDEAGWMGWPMWSVLGSYNTMWDHPEHWFMVGVGVEIPLDQGAAGARQEELRAEVERAKAEREAMRDELGARLEEARSDAQEIQTLEALYEGKLLPAARKRLEALMAAFHGGQAELGEVLEAALALRELEHEAWSNRAESWRRASRLEWALGQVPGLGGER
jgi:outer membrane protein TolC